MKYLGQEESHGILCERLRATVPSYSVVSSTHSTTLSCSSNFPLCSWHFTLRTLSTVVYKACDSLKERPSYPSSFLKLHLERATARVHAKPVQTSYGKLALLPPARPHDALRPMNKTIPRRSVA